MTNESEDKLVVNDYMDSPSAEEATSEGNMTGGGLLKKGPWTSAEDAILVEYVEKHGEGNWNAVQKHSGLFRCGKSCRLRWANHLRPDLKKGSFTPDEERRIIELHAKMGNKWARMAAEVRNDISSCALLLGCIVACIVCFHIPVRCRKCTAIDINVFFVLFASYYHMLKCKIFGS